MTYLTRVIQDQFEVGLNQEDQGILQDWLSDWNLFVNKLYQHFSLLNPVGEAATMLDNLYMKPSNKIFTYNIDFICYISQLGQGNSILCHYYYQELPNQIHDPISIQEQSNSLQVNFCSKLANNSKSTSDKHKKCLKNNLCLYYSTEDHKLDSCSKKQTMVTLKGHSASKTTDSLAAASKKPLKKQRATLKTLYRLRAALKFPVQ